MKKANVFLGCTVFFALIQAQAAPEHFEVVTISGPILGQPELSQESARSSWDSACRDWKNEARDLNKKNEILGISCDSPSCTFLDSGKTQCSSSGNYQVKTEGIQSEPPPSPVVVQSAPVPAVMQPTQVLVTQPEIIYEQAPAPRVGFIWAPGFWGWGHGHRWAWHNGYWRHGHRI